MPQKGKTDSLLFAKMFIDESVKHQQRAKRGESAMPKTSIVLSGEMMNRIEEYRRNVPGRIPSRNDALQAILERGLDVMESERKSGLSVESASNDSMESGNEA
ncbi:MAG: hypothetical protein ACYCVB_02630 [Bacilli bacterium]